ncbi:hypothetical protein ABT116_45175, partial [Streptomyces sp. NPDC002130]
MSNLIDIHTHYVPNGWPDLTEDAGPQAPWLKVESETEAMIMMGTKEFRRIQSDAWDAEVRLRDMDADGVQTQVVVHKADNVDIMLLTCAVSRIGAAKREGYRTRL